MLTCTLQIETKKSIDFRNVRSQEILALS